MGTCVHFSRSCRRILGGKPWLGGKSCQGRQPTKAGAAGPPLQGLPPNHTRPPRSTAGNISSAGCLKTGPQYKGSGFISAVTTAAGNPDETGPVFSTADDPTAHAIVVAQELAQDGSWHGSSILR